MQLQLQGLGSGFVPKPIEALAPVAVIGGAWLADSRSEGWAFAAAATAMGSVVASISFPLILLYQGCLSGVALHPDVR